MTVGDTAEVKGSLTAMHIRVSGRMDGVICGRKVELTRSAQVSGDVVHDDLSIEAGARIDGEVRRSDAKPAAKRQAAAKAAPPSKEAPSKEAVSKEAPSKEAPSKEAPSNAPKDVAPAVAEKAPAPPPVG